MYFYFNYVSQTLYKTPRAHLMIKYLQCLNVNNFNK